MQKLLNHYRKLWFYLFNRYKNKNYRLMREYFASILIAEVEGYTPLWHKKIIDVGGARGEFCKVLSERRNCDAINLDPGPYGWDSYSKDFVWPRSVVGVADKIPFADNKFDLAICRGVLEHIPANEQQQAVYEMYRVLKTGGFCYIMIPPWYNPHAGHGLKPFHIFPFKVAKRLKELVFRKKIAENSYEEKMLYPITFSRMLKIISVSGFKLSATKDTHLRLHFLTKIPLIREILIPSAVFIVTKTVKDKR